MSSPKLYPCGKHGLTIPRIGLGTMGMTAFYITNPQEVEEDALKTIDRALELGYNHFDTAYVYQSFPNGEGKTYYNEELLAKAIAKHGREKFIIATKFGIDYALLAQGKIPNDSSEEAIHRQLETSLKRLGTDYIDLYYQHRQDPNTPIEKVAATLEKLRQAGKIKYIGFSEITPDELKRAAAICPVSAIQMEYSLQTRDIEQSIIPTARALGVGIVAYSPLGRGLLSRTFAKREDIAPGDWRGTQPRLADEANAAANFAAAERLEAIAQRLGLAPATLALAWVLSKGDDIFPIPGTKAISRLEQNLAAVDVTLSADVIAEIEAAVPQGAGGRYDERTMKNSWEARAQQNV